MTTVPRPAIPLTDSERDQLLKGTSRSFFITLKALPGAVRKPIGLAYLLARTTDTVADTDAAPESLRLEILDAMNARIQGSAEAGPDWDPRALLQHAGGSQTASAAEVELLHRFDSAVATMELLSREDQTHVRAVLETIVQGQAMDLKRFSGATADRLTALSRLEETEDYTFRVAGCVGEFWTRECASHLVSAHEWDERSQVEDGIRFGKGLQWVNILRDLPRDLRMGRCYLPSEELAEVGLVPKHLLAITAWTQLKPLYLKWTDHAEEHLNAGWRYLMRTPAHQRRLRFACAVPLVLGYRTLSLLRNGNPLDPQSRIKASRAEVRSALWQIALACLGLRGWSQIQSWARESRSR